MSRRDRIDQRLREALAPAHLEIIDESHGHNVPKGAESHFRVTAVAPAFRGQALVARHREVYRLLDEELRSGLHALTLHLFSPDEWATKEELASSPPCLGGSKRERK